MGYTFRKLGKFKKKETYYIYMHDENTTLYINIHVIHIRQIELSSLWWTIESTAAASRRHQGKRKKRNNGRTGRHTKRKIIYAIVWESRVNEQSSLNHLIDRKSIIAPLRSDSFKSFSTFLNNITYWKNDILINNRASHWVSKRKKRKWDLKTQQSENKTNDENSWTTRRRRCGWKRADNKFRGRQAKDYSNEINIYTQNSLLFFFLLNKVEERRAAHATKRLSHNKYCIYIAVASGSVTVCAAFHQRHRLAIVFKEKVIQLKQQQQTARPSLFLMFVLLSIIICFSSLSNTFMSNQLRKITVSSTEQGNIVQWHHNIYFERKSLLNVVYNAQQGKRNCNLKTQRFQNGGSSRIKESCQERKIESVVLKCCLDSSVIRYSWRRFDFHLLLTPESLSWIGCSFIHELFT